MKYLTILLFTVLLFQVSYTQEEEEAIGVEVDVEAEAGEVGESEVGEEEVLGGWVDIDIDEFNSDDFSVQAKDFGVQWIIAQMIGEDAISNSSAWSLSEIRSIQGQRVNGINYKISGTYTNEEGKDFDGEFIVNAFAIGPSFEVLEISYEIEEGETVITTDEDGNESAVGPALSAGLYYPVPLWTPEELEEENDYIGGWNFVDTSRGEAGGDLEAAVNAGVEAAIKKGTSDGILAEGSTWSLQSVDFIQEQVIEGSKHIFWVTLTDGDILRYRAAIWYVSDVDGTQWVSSTGFWKTGAVDA